MKGNYDPEQQTAPLSEFVTISIEDNCLKIFQPQPKEAKVPDADVPYEVYDLCRAKVSLVPKDLTKKRYIKWFWFFCKFFNV